MVSKMKVHQNHSKIHRRGNINRNIIWTHDNLTILVSDNELARYNIHIFAICEGRLAGEGKLCKRGRGYTFWSGRGPNERKEVGVGFVVKLSIVDKMTGQRKGVNGRLMTIVNGRLMTMRLPLSRGQNLPPLPAPMLPPWQTQTRLKTILMKTWTLSSPMSPAQISSYFLVTLMRELAETPPPGKAWSESMGLTTYNSNGLILLKTWAEHDLLITNTIFHLPTRNRTS